MPTHEELARFLRRFNKLSLELRLSFIAAALALAEDLGDRGFDPTAVHRAERAVQGALRQTSGAQSAGVGAERPSRAWTNPSHQGLP